MWIDAHVHLADPRFNRTIDEVLARSRAAGVTGWVEGGIEPSNWQRQKQLRERLGADYRLAFGLHPWWVATADGVAIENAWQTLTSELPFASALGETGLDYSSRFAGSEGKQQQAFRRQIGLAKEAQKPLLLHVVKAHADALPLLESSGPFPNGGMVHSFSGSFEVAERYLRLGFFLSISGAITRPGHQTLKAALPRLPREKLLWETDAPDQLPLSSRVGTDITNEPAFLLAVAEAAGDLLKESPERLLAQSRDCLQELFD